MKRLTVCLLFAGLLTGCEDGKAKKTGPEVDVGGRLIDRDGEPLPRHGLRFQLDPPDKARVTTVFFTRDEGKFVGRCLPGHYRVTLLPSKDATDGPKPQYWEITVPEEGKTKLVLQAQ